MTLGKEAGSVGGNYHGREVSVHNPAAAAPAQSVRGQHSSILRTELTTSSVTPYVAPNRHAKATNTASGRGRRRHSTRFMPSSRHAIKLLMMPRSVVARVLSASGRRDLAAVSRVKGSSVS